MRYAVLGDIHANQLALEAALTAIERDGVDRILSVGDVVGYGAAPREVIEILREIDAIVVKGNHDAACIGELDTATFNPYAREAVEWTCGVLEPGEIDWLRARPLTVNLEDCAVSHGTYSHPERYDYIQCTDDADPSLDELTTPVCFLGHTHVPVSIMRLVDDPTRTAFTVEPELDLSEVTRALVNVGSVGQPRDEDARAAYAIYDTDAAMVWIKRVDYDIESEAKRIVAAGLPRMLADRLYLGV